MRNLALSGVMLLALASAAAAAPSEKLLKRCSVPDPKTGDLYIPEKNFPALARILTDDVLAKYGKGCKPSLSGEERAQYEDERKVLASRQLEDLKTIKKRHQDEIAAPGLPTDVASSSLGIKAKEAPIPLIIRDANTVTSISALVNAQNSADGATFSYTRDFQNDNALTSLTGAVFAYYDLMAGATAKSREAIAPFTEVTIAPGVEFDQERNRANSKKNVDLLAFHLLSEFNLPGPKESHFSSLFRFAGNVNTDSRGNTKIWTGYAEWQPVSNVYGISSGHPLYHNAPIAYQFNPIVHLEAEKVSRAGELTNVADGDFYYRAGTILSASVWFTDGPKVLIPLTLSAQYRQLWGTANSGAQRDIHYWQANAAYNLDEFGHTAITAIYRQGDLPGSGQEVRDFKTGLSVKY